MQACKPKFQPFPFPGNKALLCLTNPLDCVLPCFVGFRPLFGSPLPTTSYLASATMIPTPVFRSCLIRRAIPSHRLPSTKGRPDLELLPTRVLRQQMHSPEKCLAQPQSLVHVRPPTPVATIGQQESLPSPTEWSRHKVNGPLVPPAVRSRHRALKGIKLSQISTENTFRSLSCQRAHITPQRPVTPHARRI